MADDGDGGDALELGKLLEKSFHGFHAVFGEIGGVELEQGALLDFAHLDAGHRRSGLGLGCGDRLGGGRLDDLLDALAGVDLALFAEAAEAQALAATGAHGLTAGIDVGVGILGNLDRAFERDVVGIRDGGGAEQGDTDAEGERSALNHRKSPE